MKLMHSKSLNTNENYGIKIKVNIISYYIVLLYRRNFISIAVTAVKTIIKNYKNSNKY